MTAPRQRAGPRRRVAAARPADAAGLPGPRAGPVPAGADRPLRGRHRVRRDAGALAGPGHRDPDRARPAALRHDQLPDRRRAGSSCKRGLVNRHVLSTPLDRVRTVDLTASPIHRVLGLTTVRIGTGTASSRRGRTSTSTACRPPRARELRDGAAPRGRPRAQGPRGETAAEAPPRLRTGSCSGFDPGWAPVRAAHQRRRGARRAASLGVGSQLLDELGVFDSLDPGRRGRSAVVRLVGCWCPRSCWCSAWSVSALAVGRLPRHQLGLHADPHRPARAVLAPDPRPADHPGDHPRRRPGQRRHDRRAARAAAGRRRPALGDRHRARPRPARQLDPGPARAARGGRAGRRRGARHARPDRRSAAYGTARAHARRRYTRALAAGVVCWPSPRSCSSPSASGASGRWPSSRWSSRRRSPSPPTGPGRSGTRWSTATSSRGRAAWSASRDALETSRRDRLEPPVDLVPAPRRAHHAGRHHGRRVTVGHRARRTRGRPRSTSPRRRTRPGGQFLA